MPYIIKHKIFIIYKENYFIDGLYAIYTSFSICLAETIDIDKFNCSIDVRLNSGFFRYLLCKCVVCLCFVFMVNTFILDIFLIIYFLFVDS